MNDIFICYQTSVISLRSLMIFWFYENFIFQLLNKIIAHYNVFPHGSEASIADSYLGVPGSNPGAAEL